MSYLIFVDEDNNVHLSHHGIKGQKKGVRRWQYKDGSLTPEGYIHYGVGHGRKGGSEQKSGKSEREAYKEAKQLGKDAGKFRRITNRGLGGSVRQEYRQAEKLAKNSAVKQALDLASQYESEERYLDRSIERFEEEKFWDDINLWEKYNNQAIDKEIQRRLDHFDDYKDLTPEQAREKVEYEASKQGTENFQYDEYYLWRDSDEPSAKEYRSLIDQRDKIRSQKSDSIKDYMENYIKSMSNKSFDAFMKESGFESPEQAAFFFSMWMSHDY